MKSEKMQLSEKRQSLFHFILGYLFGTLFPPNYKTIEWIYKINKKSENNREESKQQ